MALEKSIARQEKEVADIQNLFMNLTFGTKEYEKATFSLKQAQGKLANLSAQWDELVPD